MKWIDIESEKEFRVFIYNDRVTAISQQNLYTVNQWLRDLSDTSVSIVADSIVKHFDNNIRDKLLHLGGSYTMDFALIGEDAKNGYFIEVNSFGAHYAAGSALFNWTHDHAQLYGEAAEAAETEIRFVATEIDE
jgi:hypothetical protein